VFKLDSGDSDQTIWILFHDNFVNLVCVVPARSDQSNESKESADQSGRHRYFFTPFPNLNPASFAVSLQTSVPQWTGRAHWCLQV